METINVFNYKVNETGSVTLVETTTQEIEVMSTEEIITLKEQQLLDMYNEIQKLKEK